LFLFLFDIPCVVAVTKERKMTWPGQVRIKNGGLWNSSSGYTAGTQGLQRGAGTVKENWKNIIGQDLKDMDTSWEEAEKLATDRTGPDL